MKREEREAGVTEVSGFFLGPTLSSLSDTMVLTALIVLGYVRPSRVNLLQRCGYAGT
jgi:hypothetical protein